MTYLPLGPSHEIYLRTPNETFSVGDITYYAFYNADKSIPRQFPRFADYTTLRPYTLWARKDYAFRARELIALAMRRIDDPDTLDMLRRAKEFARLAEQLENV